MEGCHNARDTHKIDPPPTSVRTSVGHENPFDEFVERHLVNFKPITTIDNGDV